MLTSSALLLRSFTTFSYLGSGTLFSHTVTVTGILVTTFPHVSEYLPVHGTGVEIAVWARNFAARRLRRAC